MEVAPIAGHLIAASMQGRRDCAAALRQQRTGEQDHQFSPGGSRKHWAKRHQNL
jgi:hypothetical protein